MMIPDCQRRLEVAHAELAQILVSIASHPTDQEVLQFLGALGGTTAANENWIKELVSVGRKTSIL